MYNNQYVSNIDLGRYRFQSQPRNIGGGNQSGSLSLYNLISLGCNRSIMTTIDISRVEKYLITSQNWYRLESVWVLTDQ